MRRVYYAASFKIFILGILMMTLSACESSGTSNSRAQIPALMSPDSVSGPAASKNNEGVDHLVQGHYDVALDYFKEALSANPNFAEAHFNMAISLDGMGNHTKATASFQKASDLGANNPKISGNDMLKKHLGKS